MELILYYMLLQLALTGLSVYLEKDTINNKYDLRSIIFLSLVPVIGSIQLASALTKKLKGN